MINAIQTAAAAGVFYWVSAGLCPKGKAQFWRHLFSGN